MLVSVVVAAVIGIPTAWSAFTLRRGGRLSRATAWLLLTALFTALVIPLVLHAAAWEATAGKFGWIFLTQSGVRRNATGAFSTFSGLLASGWIHGLYGSLILAFAVLFSTERVPKALREQSSLQRGVAATWWRVCLPMAFPWVQASLLGCALLAATEMTVVDLYTYRTVADEFYLFYVTEPSLISVAMTCVLPLAICAVMLTWMSVSRRRLVEVQFDVEPEAPTTSADSSSFLSMIASGIAITMVLLCVAIPLSGLFVKLGQEVAMRDEQVSLTWSATTAFQRLVEAPSLFASEYTWTILIASVASVVATPLGWLLAAWTRTRRRSTWFTDAIMIVMIVIPGPIVAMSMVTLFQCPLPGFRDLYQQTIIPTVMTLLFRAIPASYWMLRVSYRGVGREVFENASLEMPFLSRLWRVDRVILAKSLAITFLTVGLVASGDIPAMLPILPPGVTTVGTRLFGLLHSGARYQEASLALWYVGVATIIAWIWVRHHKLGRARVE